MAPLWLERIKEFLNDSYDQALTLDVIGRVGDVHPVHVARCFRRYYATTVGDYLRQRRIEAAIDQRLQTKRSLTRIAVDCGFSSHGHFCTVFKRTTGLTPSEFRYLRKR